MAEIRIEELILSEDELNPQGVFAIGLVDFPAHEENFVFMKKAEKNISLFKLASDEKHLVVGPAIIPEKKILQYDEGGNPFYVYFSKETTEKLSQNFLKNYGNKSFTFQHNEYVEGATLVENWIIEDPKNDKANALGFDLPAGTWMMSIKIDNLELWDKVKNSTVKGLSIEAYMASQIIENSKPKEDRILKEINDILKNK